MLQEPDQEQVSTGIDFSRADGCRQELAMGDDQYLAKRRTAAGLRWMNCADVLFYVATAWRLAPAALVRPGAVAAVAGEAVTAVPSRPAHEAAPSTGSHRRQYRPGRRQCRCRSPAHLTRRRTHTGSYSRNGKLSVGNRVRRHPPASPNRNSRSAMRRPVRPHHRRRDRPGRDASHDLPVEFGKSHGIGVPDASTLSGLVRSAETATDQLMRSRH